MAKTIYIKRLRALGDVVLTLPLVHYFLAQGHRVVLISHYTALIKPTSGLRLCSNYNRWNKWMMELRVRLIKNIQFIDLDQTYEQNPSVSILENYRLASGAEELGPFPTHLMRVQDSKPAPKTILFHLQAPSTNLPYRGIHHVDWEAVEQALKSTGYQCVELIQEGDTALLEHSVAPRLEDLPQVVQDHALFVGLDSGPAHIATGLGKPSVLFFGSVNPELRLWSTEGVTIMQNACPFAGCYHNEAGTVGVACVRSEYPTPPCCTFETDTVIQHLLERLT